MLHNFFYVSQMAALKSEHIIAISQICVGRVGGFIVNDSLVNTRRQYIDHVDVAGELAVFFARNRARNKYAQVTNALVHRINDGLAMRQDLTVTLIEIGDPAQRLRRGRDVVTF